MSINNENPSEVETIYPRTEYKAITASEEGEFNNRVNAARRESWIPDLSTYKCEPIVNPISSKVIAIHSIMLERRIEY